MKNLSPKQKRELEDKAVLTDWDAIIDKKIERRVGKTEKIVVIENKKTRAVIHEQTDLIKELKNSKIHPAVNSLLIIICIILMLACTG